MIAKNHDSPARYFINTSFVYYQRVFEWCMAFNKLPSYTSIHTPKHPCDDVFKTSIKSIDKSL